MIHFLSCSLQLILAANSSYGSFNATKTERKQKSHLPTILGSIFGSLAIVGLIVAIVMYILFNRDNLKIFDRLRISKKNTGQTKILDSSSALNGLSASKN